MSDNKKKVTETVSLSYIRQVSLEAEDVTRLMMMALYMSQYSTVQYSTDVTYPECDHDDALLSTGGVRRETRIFIPTQSSPVMLTCF